MIPTLVFDLETIPDADGLRRLNPQWADLPDADLIESALAQRRETHGNDFLPLHLQKIAVVGCVFRDDQGFRVRTLGQADDPEETLISGFFKTIGHYTPTLVSWNGSGFDLPVLHYRSLIHGVAAPRYWDTGEDDRDFRFNNYLNRYHTRHIDLMDVLAKFNGRANAPLDQLAKLCGFPGKLDMDGGQVWQVDLPEFTTQKVKKQGPVYAHFGPTLAGNKLYVASGDGVLRVFDPGSGNLIGQAELPGGAATAPVVAGQTLYVVSRNGQLLAFR